MLLRGLRLHGSHVDRARHPQRASTVALAGVHRLSSDVPGARRVHGHHRGRACAWETSGLFRAQLLVPVSQADEEYLQAWQARHGHTWPMMNKDHPEVLRLLRKHEDWVRTTWEELPL